MLTQANRQSDAELQYFRVLDMDPSNIPATFYLGDLYQFWQPEARTVDAISQFQTVITRSPTSTLATTARERLTILGGAIPNATPLAGTPGTPIATPVA